MTCLHNIDIAILCGGKGSRIKSVLGDVPKVLAPINGKPYLEHLLAKLKHHGARKIVLCAGHLSDKLQEWMETRPDDGLSVLLAVEPVQSGTVGALRYASVFLESDPVLVCNGDTLTDADLCDFLVRHERVSVVASVLYTPCVEGVIQHSGYYLIPQWLLRVVISQYDEPLLERALTGRATIIGNSQARFLDIGVPARLEAAEQFVEQLAG